VINGDIFNGIVVFFVLVGMALAGVLGGLVWLVWWVLQHLRWVG
jgi:hypothetical protein